MKCSFISEEIMKHWLCKEKLRKAQVEPQIIEEEIPTQKETTAKDLCTSGW